MSLLHDLPDARAAADGSRAALCHQGRTYTYAELEHRSRNLARGLRELGIARGDRVAAYMKNRPEVVEAALACSRIGAVFVPINPMLKSRQVAHILHDSCARMLISNGPLLSSLGGRHEFVGLETVVSCDAGPRSKDTVVYEDLLACEAGAFGPAAIDKDPAVIMYTSASTGLPKGVVVSHRNLVSGATCVAGYLGNSQDDRILAALPLSFDYGFSQITTAFAVGAAAVLTQYSLAAALIREVEAERITGLAGVPTMWIQLAASEWPREAGKGLRYITNSGGALPRITVDRLRGALPDTRIFSMYGLTEAFRSTYLDPDELDRRPTSIGKAIPNQEIFVLRPDGTSCEPEEPGELVHRGSLVTLGYWNAPELTTQRFRPLPASNGLVHETAVWSGDIVKRDTDGYLYFLGRQDQQIKTSGYRVSPTEVEDVAMEVAGVVEVVAVGLPDEVLGQSLALGYVADSELDEPLRQYCRRHLPAFMMPLHFVRLESIARNANGKHDRAAALEDVRARVLGKAADDSILPGRTCVS